jgi:hypothetical protein
MRTTSPRSVRITHRSSGEVIAEGPLGLWGITPFEGNLYIRRKYLRTSHLRPNWVPGLCIYKFLYVWLDLRVLPLYLDPNGYVAHADSGNERNAPFALYGMPITYLVASSGTIVGYMPSAADWSSAAANGLIEYLRNA